MYHDDVDNDVDNWIYAINNIKTDGVACGFWGTLEEPGEHHRRGGQSSQSVTCITVCNRGSIRVTSRFFVTVQLPLNSFSPSPLPSGSAAHSPQMLGQAPFGNEVPSEGNVQSITTG